MELMKIYDLCCPVCQDVFKDPVVLSCSHSFCKECLKNWWREKPARECPVCKTRVVTEDRPSNLVLNNLCETFLVPRDQRDSEGLCSLHSEKLKLFCLDHLEPICSICRDSKKHTDHRFRPIDEAAQDHRENLKTFLDFTKQTSLKCSLSDPESSPSADSLRLFCIFCTHFRGSTSQILRLGVIYVTA
uniref:RING-type domain-containing protein n=1 Tax=Xiphophorus couchianus TaxID=32473 RepID=A0A3B5MHK0_9TELE